MPSTDQSRAGLLARYRRNRERSASLFALLSDAAYYSQPIALRHPIVFYEGHLPGFSFNALVKKALGQPSVDPRLESLFARGIDPHESGPSNSGPSQWPSRDAVRVFAEEADRRVVEALAHAEIDKPGHPLLDRKEAAFAILEHEEMHQETLLYMWHRLPFDQKTAPAGYRPRAAGVEPRHEWIDIPAGAATLGVSRDTIQFAWDNEGPDLRVEVEAFSIERHDVTNARFMDFVEAGGYGDPQWWVADDWQWIRAEQREHPLFWERHDEAWFWRGMFERSSAATIVARVRQPRGSVGLRPVAGDATADGGRVPACSLRQPGR